jgi:DNA end-binding protein Ku
MRALWSGGISFGLIFIPVKLYSAVQSVTLDLDMLDERDKAPIRYARMNKVTGEEVPWNDVVKGFEYSKGEYVVLEDEDFEKANVKKSKTIEIVSFVERDEIELKYIEKPYYLEPDPAAQKTYALLREALKESNKVGIAEFVLRDREHLVILQPENDVLILNQLRYESEIKPTKGLVLPTETEFAKKEMAMAIDLIEQMSDKFKPSKFKDNYIAELKAVIEVKAKHRRVKVKDAEAPQKVTQVADLMEQLRKSLEQYQTVK